MFLGQLLNNQEQKVGQMRAQTGKMAQYVKVVVINSSGPCSTPGFHIVKITHFRKLSSDRSKHLKKTLLYCDTHVHFFIVSVLLHNYLVGQLWVNNIYYLQASKNIKSAT